MQKPLWRRRIPAEYMNRIRVVASVLVCAIGFGAMGYVVGSGSIMRRPPAAAPVASSSAFSANELDADTALLWEAIGVAREKYIRSEEVTDKDFLYGAIRGAIGALGDPYSAFFEPSDAKKFEEDVEGVFGGIGAELAMRSGQLVVVSPLKGNPAEEVGLKPGDVILEIDGDPFINGDVEEAVKRIRGVPDTVVKLLVMREGWNTAKEFAITRAIIQIPTLDWKMLEAGGKQIAYIQLYNFNSNAIALFETAAWKSLLEGAEGMVLDLRGNPGGYLDVAVEIGGWFFDRGVPVVKERFRGEKIRALRAHGNASLKNMPVVVLVDNGSASASEILAGALRDNLGAKLIGEKTFGKGSVQEIEHLRDGSTLKVSIAEWLTPGNHSIEKTGLTPDMVVKKPENGNGKDTLGNPGKDEALKKALELLLQQPDNVITQ